MDKKNLVKNKYSCKYSTIHYDFYFADGSLAAQNIHLIAKEQEECFNKICNKLKIDFSEKIQYYLLESPEEVGILYGDDDPMNGFAVWGENKIYAVYNENIKCIGPHEDTHLISFKINAPKSYFLVEGLAMYFDEKWWGIDNEAWTSYYKHKNKDISIYKLFNNDIFDSYNCEITYPIAGAFTKYLIDSFGIEKYIELYKVKDNLINEDFRRIFKYTIQELENSFWKKISKVSYDLKLLESAL